MDDGRDDEGVGRPAGDRAEKRTRRGFSQQDRARAAVNADLGVARAAHVKQRHRDEADGVWPDRHRRAARRAVRDHAAVGELGALRPAGGAGGVHHEANVVRAGAAALVGLPGREKRLVLVAVPADHHPPRNQAVRAGGGRDVGELRSLEEDHGPGILENVADLVGAQPEVRGHGGGTEGGRRQCELDGGEVVEVQHGQPVAGAHPGVAQGTGQPQDPLPPLPPGEGLRAESDRGVVGARACPVIEPVAKQGGGGSRGERHRWPFRCV